MIEVTTQGRAEVEAVLRRRDVSPRVRERLEMVKAAALRRDLVAIAQWSGRTERTVARWLGAYESGGVEALADAPRSGRPVSADGAYLGALGKAVDTPPRSLGLGFDGWTSDRLSAYLASGTGVRISPGWLRALLAAGLRDGPHKTRYRYGRPKHTLSHLRDEAEVAACEAELAEVGGKGGCGATEV